MRKATINFTVDLLCLAALLALTFTGVVIKYVLPPGTGGRHRRLAGGRAAEEVEDLWLMTRHEWGSVHFYLALAFLVLIAIHVVLHWQWIKAYLFNRKRPT